ncbi:hypothetical protein GIB67_013477 [Kingdonia uniflora]|uniref:FHA domain-containing protein n=1 Tax=Kingdonia uniflora TaxID=39325 RepID=A0A7J7LR46_9MAGN|nr:hypothetical protein GIB67_013477 [Kingdonia uniflora]
MYGRRGLDRFKKAESLEPFSVTLNTKQQQQQQQSELAQQKLNTETVVQVQAVTQIGGGQSNWQPPDWAIEPRPGVYYLDVLKGSEVLGQISLDKRKHIFGRQFPVCDYVLDHQSVSRQHAVVVPHKNGSIYVIDLGSVHGTFVANERLTKEIPVELEEGQSLRFAASTRSYILRKNNAALFPPPPLLTEINLPPPPDPSNEEAVLAYNTIVNRYGIEKLGLVSKYHKYLKNSSGRNGDSERPAKRIKKATVSFRDQFGGELIEVVGVSDGADVGTEPGPVGVKEGSLVGKYESLVQTTIVPKGKDQVYSRDEKNPSSKGVTDRLMEVLNKVKGGSKGGGIYDDLYGDSFSNKVGSSWAYGQADSTTDTGKKVPVTSNEKSDSNTTGYDNDDLFGDCLD